MARTLHSSKRSTFMRNAAAGALAAALFAAPAQAIVPNDNFPRDPAVPGQSAADAAIDTTGGVNGVGMFARGDGFVCSGTLINPRTVLFAAHCVNDRAATDYANTVQAAWQFDPHADQLLNFIRDQLGITNGTFNPTANTYLVNQIQYDPRSLQNPGAFGFLEADIAIATLDRPASDIPTWALLFSPLPTPGAIDPVTGTGYHVNITGYGRSGSGTTGASQGIDFRRRAAENMLGALTSFDERNTFLFGQPFGNLPQSLYRLDFDDPAKTNPFDFNLYKDEPLTREGTTAGGDSGGPLILDAANNSLATEDLQIGVLSGGSRFFGPQVFSSYGTESFYQPLYLFWDYIAATNPYRYVSAVAGDGNWEDGAHWQTDLDPNYRIINGSGAVVNGIPTSPGAGITGGSPDFGEVCFDPEGANPGDGCQDLSNGNATPPARETVGTVESRIGRVSDETLGVANATAVASGGTVADSSDGVANVAVNRAGPGAAAQEEPHGGAGMIAGGENVAHANGNGVDFAVEAPHNGVELADNQAQNGGAESAEEQPQGISGGEPEFAAGPNPGPTIANGLPGATGFVPNNVESDVPNGVTGRYFDVTLNQAGTTTLSSNVTIDRLSISGSAGLNVAAAGNLTSLIDVTQAGGVANVDGTITSRGDYLLMAGLLSGSGTVAAPFLTSVAGMVAPGTMGGVGTLTIDGNAVFSSGTTFLIDVGASGTSDVVAVTGDVSLGGNVAFAPIAGFNSIGTSNYTILTNGGTQTGTLGSSTVGNSAILNASFTYNANSVDVAITPGSYQNAVNGNNPVQVSYAGLMDRNRGNAAFNGLFQTLDLADAATIQATFDSWAPTTESAAQSMARGVLGQVSDFHQNRLSFADRSDNGGTIAVIGQPVQLAAASLGGFGVNGGSNAVVSAAASSAQTEVRSGGVNEDMAIYLAGGFVSGDGGSMPLTNPAAGASGEDEFDGFFIAGGLEYYFSDDALIGVSAYYSDIDADVALNQQAEGRAILGSVYGRTKTFWDLVLDARVTVGTYKAETLRNVALGGQAFRLTTDDNSFVFASEIGLSKELDLLDAIIAPGIKARAAKVNFDTVNEAGGGPALTIVRPDYNSIQGLAGVEFRSKPNRPLQLRASMHYVHEFNDNPNVFGANFVGGNAPLAPFALVNPDRDWGEASVGVRYNAGSVSFDLSADTTLGRSDVDSQVYSGAVTFRF